MFYSHDSDLTDIRPKILEMGVASWEEKHRQAFQIINRDLKAWYCGAAKKHGINPSYEPFDPERLLNTYEQLNRLSCFKTLELIYGSLTKDMPEDPFAVQRDYFAKSYKEELKIIMETGLDYDWNCSGNVDEREKSNPKPKTRTLERI